MSSFSVFFFFFQAEDGIRDGHVTGVQTCALPILWIEVDRRDLASKRVEDRFTPQAYLRDRLPLGTNRGWYVAASAMPHFGLGDDENDFVRYTVEGQYFLPMGFGTDGIASRVQLAAVRSSETPMFYLMPTLGGAYSVRGFRPHRFRAENTQIGRAHV